MDDKPTVDLRFLLANERTLLAWTRTALALLAGGGALTQLSGAFHGRTVLAATVTGLGIATVVIGAVRFARTQRALLQGESPRPSLGPLAVSASIAVVGLGLFVAIVSSR